MPVVEFLGSDSPDLFADLLRAFRQRLKETGYVEGQNLAIEYRWAEGHNRYFWDWGCAFNRSVQHRLQSIGWRLEAQGLSRTLIEPQSNRVKITLRDAREIGSSREVLPQQAVGVLV